MKTIIYVIIMVCMPLCTAGQSLCADDQEAQELFLLQSGDRTSISKFAMSVNPAGFMQFGPIINAEFGLSDDLVLNTHIRFPVLGLLTYVVKYHDDGLDRLNGIAFGGGIIKFFGESMHKPYIGGLLEYHRVKTLYAEGESWEWENRDNLAVFVANGGYRFRMDGGFFINLGGYLGAAVGTYKWEYTDPSYSESGDSPSKGLDVTPFGMLEATFGIEF